MFTVSNLFSIGLGLVLFLLFLAFLFLATGLVVVRENEVGILVKRFGKSLPAGQLIALKGEAGYQADTLAPGWHLGIWRTHYIIRVVKAITIPQGQIGLIVAASGEPIPVERLLGSVVDCDNFQDARKFLANGGQKGRQLGILTAGTYRINTALFQVITAANASHVDMRSEDLRVHEIKPGMVGIVSTLDGDPIDEGEIAGPMITGHNNYQDAAIFLHQGGRRGLQEQVLLSGAWNLNPWFVQVEQVPMTEIPIGYVGIVISYVGKAHEDVSGESFKHGNLVEPGHKGVWVTPLYPGKHPLNSRTMKVELVPTTNIVLNWAQRTEAHAYDAKLSPITVRSRDGFAFNLDIAQIIHIGATDAPKVISRAASVQNLVDHVLQPIVGNYFRNSAQEYTVLDFLNARSERQAAAAKHINTALAAYDVQAIDTLIGDITPPERLMITQTDRKIAEEERLTYQVQRQAQIERQELVRETAMADIQQEMVKSEQGVQIARLAAQSAVEQAKGDAIATREVGQAKADVYRSGVDALGPQGYVTLQLMQIVGENKLRIVPDVSVTGSQQGTLVDSLLGLSLRDGLHRHNGVHEADPQ
ncbi:MAG: hypothetical protein KDE59_24950 [Anaerolineales bacterium]|nr:hypothetical protein [Anaerolineales bacterium]